ncbi:glycosyl hydrolase [Verrucomicrobiota bacterium]
MMTTRIQKLSYSLTACLLLCGCHVTSEENSETTGPYFGFVLDGYPITAQKLTDLKTKTGMYGDFIVFYLQWPAPERTNEAEFPRDTVERIWSVGAMPCLTWEPMYLAKGQEVIVPASEITGGRYDEFIRAFARQAADWGKPLLVRFAHEMNLQRYHWGTSKEKYGPESPALYSAMFRHVVDVAREAGGSNLVWVFCPNAESVPNSAYDSNATWNAAPRPG